VTKVKDKQTEHHRISNHSPSGLTSPICTIPFCFYSPDDLPAAQPKVSKHWRQLAQLSPYQVAS